MEFWRLGCFFVGRRSGVLGFLLFLVFWVLWRSGVGVFGVPVFWRAHFLFSGFGVLVSWVSWVFWRSGVLEFWSFASCLLLGVWVSWCSGVLAFGVLEFHSFFASGFLGVFRRSGVFTCVWGSVPIW